RIGRDTLGHRAGWRRGHPDVRDFEAPVGVHDFRGLDRVTSKINPDGRAGTERADPRAPSAECLADSLTYRTRVHGFVPDPPVSGRSWTTWYGCFATPR